MAKSKEIIPIEDLLPQNLIIISLRGRPIFPGIFTPLIVNEEGDVKAIRQAYNGDGFIGLVLQKNFASILRRPE